MKGYKFRLYPNDAQIERFDWTLARCCELSSQDPARTEPSGIEMFLKSPWVFNPRGVVT